MDIAERVDEAIASLGKFNKWQVLQYCMVCLSVTVSGCWHMMSIVFTGGEPGHHCAVPAGQLVNETIPIIGEGRKAKYSQCKKYINFTVDNTTMKCDQGWFYDDEFESTIVSDWDLVCDKNYLVETSQSVFNFGVMMGAIVFTTLADKIGRKPVHLGCQYIMIVIGIAIAFAPNYISFVILRFFLGAVREGAGLVGIVIACELFPAAQRTFAGAALELFWAGSWMLLAGIAYLERDWRNFQLAITLPPIISIVLIWVMPESVAWLVANNRIDEAEAILQRATKFNGRPVNGEIISRSFSSLSFKRPDAEKSPYGEQRPYEERRDSGIAHDDTTLANGRNNGNETAEDANEETKMLPRHVELKAEENHSNCAKDENKPPQPNTETMSTSHSKSKLKKNKFINYVNGLCPGKQEEQKAEPKIDVAELKFTCLDILKSRKMLLNTFIMCSLWFASGVIYYGLSLSTSTLAGDKYVNFFLSGAVEMPAYGMTVYVLQRFGRRWPLAIFHLVAAVVLFVNIYIPEETDSGTSLVPLIITLTMVGKFSITAAFGTIVLYAPEIYPTNIRNLGFGLASVCGRIGSMIAPFAAYIAKIVYWVPGLAFTIIALVTGFMTLLLPETLNRPLPETIEEIEAWKNSTRKLDLLNKSKPIVLVVRNKSGGKSNDETAV